MKKYKINKLTLNNGETIAYRKAKGTGETPKNILLIHGNMSSSVNWQTTMEQLELRGYTVYAPDLRGFGDSSYNTPFDSLKSLAEDIKEFTDQINLDRFVLIGWSTGGGIALELAELIPDKVSKVITLGSVPVTGYPIYKKDEKGLPILTELYTTKEEIANDRVQTIPVLNALKENNRDFIKLALDHSMYLKSKPHDDDYEYYIDAVFKQRCFVDTIYSLLTFNFDPSYVTYPIIMLHGSEDPIVPLEWGKTSQQNIGGRAELIVLEGMGHSLPTDNLERFIDCLMEVGL